MGFTLRVWEDSLLHGSNNGGVSIVQWASTEYDNAYQDENGDLVINKAVPDKFSNDNRQVWLIVGRVKAGYWKKYQLDEEATQPVDEFKNEVKNGWGDTGNGWSKEENDEAAAYNKAVNADFHARMDNSFSDLDVRVGSFARSDDPFADVPPLDATVTRADVGAHEVPDDTPRVPGDPYVTTAAPFDPENVTVISPDMRAKVLERLGEHVEKIGHKQDEPPTTSPTNTSLLGLQDTTLLPTVGDREVFSK